MSRRSRGFLLRNIPIECEQCPFVEMANMALVGKVDRGARYLLILLASLLMKNAWQRKLKLNGKIEES